jgi:hypothetical protein
MESKEENNNNNNKKIQEYSGRFQRFHLGLPHPPLESEKETIIGDSGISIRQTDRFKRSSIKDLSPHGIKEKQEFRRFNNEDPGERFQRPIKIRNFPACCFVHLFPLWREHASRSIMRCSLSRSKPPRRRKRGGKRERQPTRPMGRSSPSYLLSPESNPGRGISISNAVPKRRSGREDSVEEPGACSLWPMLLLQQGKKKKKKSGRWRRGGNESWLLVVVLPAV